jgi:hypothetical protein
MYLQDNFARPTLRRGFSNSSISTPYVAALSGEDVHRPWTISAFPGRSWSCEVWY